jgi:threonine dehydrogenase-like Zn-dependent dehydrogenase
MGKGIITPEALITHKFPLEDYREAFELMRDRKGFYQKVMLEVK